VLDNYKHVLDAAPLASELAASISRLTVLATSRERLNVTGEHVAPVSPLDIPAHDHAIDPGRLGEHSSVSLFVDRARAVQPAFALTEDNAAAVAEVCVKVDGLPLAIELAAARTPLLSPEAMGTSLDRLLPLLIEGPRDAPERQRTLEKTIAWSYDLLSDSQQRSLQRLSVFSGGWTSDAAAAVSAATIDDLSGLREMSLIRESDAEQHRFTMLRTIREFALERAREYGEDTEARQRHAEYFQARFEHADDGLRGPSGAAWLSALDLEYDNLRTALAWWLESGDGERALRLACSIRRFFYTRGHFTEGRRWVRDALDAASSPPYDLVNTALNLLARLSLEMGEMTESRSLAEQSLSLARARDDASAIRDALEALANVISAQGDFEGAEALQREEIEVARQIGDRRGEASGLLNLGYNALCRHDFDQAETLFQTSIDLFSVLGWREGEGFGLMNLALVKLQQKSHAEAASLVEDGLVALMEVGSKGGISFGLECLAALVCEQCKAIDAMRLLAGAEGIRRGIGVDLSSQPYEHALHERTVAMATNALGEQGALREAENGRAMTEEELCSYAQQLCAELQTLTGQTGTG